MTARALARAMLAGPREARGLAARMAACLDARPAWLQPLAVAMARIPGEVWRRLDVGTLAARVQCDAGFIAAWLSDERPVARRYLLRPPTELLPAPLEAPHWPAVGDLALGLGLTPAGLWRLTLPAGWQRRRPLAEQHYRAALVPKRSGEGWRLLEAPQPHLLAVQRRLLAQLLDPLPPHEAAFGFTRGRSVVQHARCHAGQAVLLCFDLQDFFSSIPAARVHALLAALGLPTSVARALTALCTTATPEALLARWRADGRLSWAQAQRLRDAHLPQGAPTSPALANLCAFGLDQRLAGLAERFGARYSRYADDIVISGPAPLRHAAGRLVAWVREIAADEGFALNPRKTRRLSDSQRQSVCGIVVNAHPNLPREDFDRLKAVLHRCVVDGPSAQNRAGHVDWRGHLHGRVAWAAQLNPVKAERLRRLLAQIDWAR
jgi:hypothetical protein